jgi:hypothetical protein
MKTKEQILEEAYKKAYIESNTTEWNMKDEIDFQKDFDNLIIEYIFDHFLGKKQNIPLDRVETITESPK